MKCIKKGTQILRIGDKIADKKVEKEGWKYIPKSEWKKNK